MRVFITVSERNGILAGMERNDQLIRSFLDALKERVYGRIGNVGLGSSGDFTSWYYPAAEYLSDAAMLHCLYPEEKLATWIKSVSLAIARTSEHDWAGPAFRDHTEPYTGHLETAHLCWALAAALDLSGEIFTIIEKKEIETALGAKGLELCERWIQKNTHLANWRGIMVSGVVVAASVLGNEEILDAYIPELQQCAVAFQPDGSYGESLQYGNYLAFALMLGYESLIRRYPQKAAQLDVSAYAKGISWITSSMFYAKPVDGWGAEPRARAANFNDSAALFRPSGDLLLHVAARHGHTAEAGLAFYLFGKYYQPVPYQGPHDLATFGMRNDWGFLTLPFLSHHLESVTPQSARLPLTVSFSNGQGFMRDQWEGNTIVAVNGGGDGLYGPGHLHGDVNSFILVHQNERLLADPGHSCYRNLIHGLESASQTHNTCTFLVNKDQLGLQEDLAKATLLEQKNVLERRRIINAQIGDPINRGCQRLLSARCGSVSAIGCEAALVYGEPLRQFSRFWLLAGSNVLFVVDRIIAEKPVTTVWNWLVNNRDGKTRYENGNNILTAKRGTAGMKLFQTGNTNLSFPVYAYLHDAYHVEPGQLGEGRPGSGLLFRHTERESAVERTMVTVIAMDTRAGIDSWKLMTEHNEYRLTNGEQNWNLQVQDEASRFTLGSNCGGRWDIVKSNGNWSLEGKE